MHVLHQNEIYEHMDEIKKKLSNSGVCKCWQKPQRGSVFISQRGKGYQTLGLLVSWDVSVLEKTQADAGGVLRGKV